MEKTFEELIADKVTQQQTRDGQYTIYPDDVLELLQQVREATSEEFCQALLGVNLPAETVKKIGKIVTTTDRILTDK